MDVTGLTATRMLAIEAASVVSGAVNGGTGHLILTKHDGSTIDAGNVKGATGSTGATGATGAAGAGFIVCTSSTRPGSPTLGEFIFETDTKLSWFWDGSKWVRADWSAAWGNVAETVNTTNATNISATTLTDTGLSVTWTAVAGRKYRIKCQIMIQSVTNPGILYTAIVPGASGAGTPVSQDVELVSPEGEIVSHVMSPILTPSAGSLSYHIQAKVSVGSSAAWRGNASANAPSIITVDDVGPNGTP